MFAFDVGEDGSKVEELLQLVTIHPSKEVITAWLED